MTRDPRFDILFEPVRIGPVTARNRFYQVPHCNGMGYRDPEALAAMRSVKAEGGWAVVATEECEISPDADLCPAIELRLWDDGDIPALARTADAVHAHGALAAIELVHGGMNATGLFSREPPVGPSHLPAGIGTIVPVQARAMDGGDIAALRRRHRAAAQRAVRAGFDIVYVYAGHQLTVLQQFLSPDTNHRADAYGGSLANRARLLAEVLADTRDAVGDRCAVACRLALDAVPEGELAGLFDLLGELPDLWDIVPGNWEVDSVSSRFAGEAANDALYKGIKALTTKPVVGVGRFTSPDTMVRQVREGLLDLIGAARPSIADPFLPEKIRDGRIDDIRECIGCNICVAGDNTQSPIRCTQNSSMGEEWRRGWHPERIRARATDDRVLIVGGGPAGLEGALWLGKRGHEVALAEEGPSFGGRVSRESALPGLASWARVRDYRLHLLRQMANVSLYPASALGAQDVLDFGAGRVVLATGSLWRRDGVGRHHRRPVPFGDGIAILTPDDVMAGSRPAGSGVVLYDDEHFYLGGVLAELLAREGFRVTLVTPAADVSHWTHNTLEQARIQKRLIEAGVAIRPHEALSGAGDGAVRTACVFTGSEQEIAADSLVLVTARLPREELLDSLRERRAEWHAAGLLSVEAIGDARAPGTIAAAVHAGRLYAETLGAPGVDADAVPFRRERTALAGGSS